MPLPIAHGLMGASIVIAGCPNSFGRDHIEWNKVLLGAVLAILPDLDFVVIWFFDFGKSWHRGFSHSLLLAVVVGALFSFLVKPSAYIRYGIVYGGAMASHGLLDALVSVKGGVELLWPVSFHRFASGLYEFPETMVVNYYTDIDLLAIKGGVKFLYMSCIEFLIMGPLLVVTWVVKRNSRVRASGDADTHQDW